MADVCFITTCMGRLEHLRQTLGSLAAQPRAAVVLVDFSCPQVCGAWAEQQFSTVRVVRVPGQARFQLARARNLGAEAAEAPWLCFIDADIGLDPSFMMQVLPLLKPGFYYRAQSSRKDLSGTVICPTDAFRSAGGYDDLMQGWGYEDVDLYRRLDLAGLREAFFPGELLRPLDHGHERRVENYAVKDMVASHMANWVYSQVKRDLMKLDGGLLPEALRRQLYDEAVKLVALWHKHRKECKLEFTYRQEAVWIGPDFSRKLTYTLSPREPPAAG